MVWKPHLHGVGMRHEKNDAWLETATFGQRQAEVTNILQSRRFVQTRPSIACEL
jgi:hypothetical protein